MLRAEIWIATTLISIGVIGGMLYNWPTAQPLEMRDNPGQFETNSELPAIENDLADSISLMPENELEPVISLDGDEVERGDNYLLGGNAVAAYREYVKAANQEMGIVSAPLLLRMAMASESLGDHVRAEGLYQKSIKHSKLQNIRLLALSGLSRSWIAQGKLEHSFELLAEMNLLYVTPQEIAEEIRNQIHYQIAEVSQRLYLQSLEIEGTNLEELEFKWCDPNMDDMLGLIDLAVTKTAADPVTSTDQLEAFGSPGDDANLTMVRAKTQVQTVRNLLQEISDRAELKFTPTRLANVAISNRTSKLNFDGPLSVVLDLTLSPLNLVWEQTGDQVKISHQDESENETDTYKLERAKRLLRRVELDLPTSVRRISSMLHVGNIALLSGDLETATNRYEELQVSGVNGELAAQLNFNLAILDRLKLRDDVAIERLYFSVDQSLDQGIKAKGYSRIARMHLENGNTEGAIYAADRGLALATLPLMQEKTALTLARAFLLQGKSYEANKVLFDNRDGIKSSTGMHLAGVYGAYARLLGKTEDKNQGLRDERTRLIVSMSHLMPDDTADFIDALLVARAFYAVGFTNRSIDLLRKAIETRHRFWQRRAAYDLATVLYESGQLREALKAYEVIYKDDLGLGNTGADAESVTAQLNSANINLMLEQPQICLDHCEQLWKWKLNEAQKSETLTYMGRAYRKMGRHHTAAVCFAGMIPKPEDNVPAEVSTQ